MAVHGRSDLEPGGECDAAAVEAQDADPEVALLGELHERPAREVRPLGPAERRAVGPPLPAQAVNRERLVERRVDPGAVARHDDLERSELPQLPLGSAAPRAPLLRGAPLVRRLPAVGHLEHGRSYARDRAQAVPGGACEHAVAGQTGCVEHVRSRVRERLQQLLGRRDRLARREQDVGQGRFVPADELGDADAPAAADDEGGNAHELGATRRDRDAGLVLVRILTQPRRDPGREQEGTRPGRRGDEAVPFVLQFVDLLGRAEIAKAELRRSRNHVSNRRRPARTAGIKNSFGRSRRRSSRRCSTCAP